MRFVFLVILFGCAAKQQTLPVANQAPEVLWKQDKTARAIEILRNSSDESARDLLTLIYLTEGQHPAAKRVATAKHQPYLQQPLILEEKYGPGESFADACTRMVASNGRPPYEPRACDEIAKDIPKEPHPNS